MGMIRLPQKFDRYQCGHQHRYAAVKPAVTAKLVQTWRSKLNTSKHFNGKVFKFWGGVLCLGLVFFWFGGFAVVVRGFFQLVGCFCFPEWLILKSSKKYWIAVTLTWSSTLLCRESLWITQRRNEWRPALALRERGTAENGSARVASFWWFKKRNTTQTRQLETKATALSPCRAVLRALCFLRRQTLGLPVHQCLPLVERSCCAAECQFVLKMLEVETKALFVSEALGFVSLQLGKEKVIDFRSTLQFCSAFSIFTTAEVMIWVITFSVQL